MKAVILAGGFGSRLSEETNMKPKPMVEIGDKPILWHVMKIYSFYGINDFIICCGYKGYLIKEYFANYSLHMSDVTFDIKNNVMKIHKSYVEPWSVTVIETGLETMTGGRLKRIGEYVKNDESFCFTYCDGLSDINMDELISFHKSHNQIATVTAVRPPERFGILDLDNKRVMRFREKKQAEERWINGGFFVLCPKVLEYIDDDSTVWEKQPMEKLVQEGNLVAYLHEGFWHPMDTLQDKNRLNELWSADKAPWKKW